MSKQLSNYLIKKKILHINCTKAEKNCTYIERQYHFILKYQLFTNRMYTPVGHCTAFQTLEMGRCQTFLLFFVDFHIILAFIKQLPNPLVLQRYEIITMIVAQTNVEAVNSFDLVVCAGPDRCCVSCFKNFKYFNSINVFQINDNSIIL